MPPQKRVADPKVVGAIQKWRGNVQAAAEDLGMAPVNLRKRLNALGVDLSFLRAADRYRTGGTQRDMSDRIGSNKSADTPRPEKRISAGISITGAGRSTLHAMTTTATALAEEQRAARPKPARLTPPHEERLREAKFDLQHVLRAEISETRILEWFFGDAFEGWIAGKVNPAGAEKPRKGTNGDDRKAAK